MKEILIKSLFRLLGHTTSNIYSVQYLFGATTLNHEGRRKNWERALARMWKDKDLLDFLYYQAETDKENVWRGKIDKKLSQGARIRTLFLVYSAKRAYLQTIKKKQSPDDRADTGQELSKVEQIYKKTIDI